VDERIPYIKGDVINSKVAEWLSSYTEGKQYEPFSCGFIIWMYMSPIYREGNMLIW